MDKTEEAMQPHVVKTTTIRLSFSSLNITLLRAGEGMQVIVLGGDRPHIGCTVLAVPRPSLSGDGSVSATSSVLNVSGHKDEEIVRPITEKVCAVYNLVTAGSGGFHCDNMKKAQILEVKSAVADYVKHLKDGKSVCDAGIEAS